ncbi:MAG: helix-turn-helix transcriptional regulator [Bacteroidales bacterium]|nr:helix-turn-helix transcriptional regulator [Bacteroidales bacterium]
MINNQLKSFGDYIRKLRIDLDLPLRKVAAYLDIDPSTLGKIERNERKAPKELINKLAKILKANSKELLISYYSDMIAKEIYNDGFTEDILKVSEQKINYLKKINND